MYIEYVRAVYLSSSDVQWIFSSLLVGILQHLPVDTERRGSLIDVVPQSVTGDYEKILGAVQRYASNLGLAADVRFIRNITWKKKNERALLEGTRSRWLTLGANAKSGKECSAPKV